MYGETSIAKQTIAWTQFKLTRDTRTGIIFNWFNLLDCTEFVAEWNYDDINSVQLDTYNAPRVDWGWVLGYYINGKQVEFKLIMSADTEEKLNDNMDLLKKELAVEDWMLEISINWEYRRWEANLTALNFNRDFEKTTIQNNITLSFNMTNHLYAETSDAITEGAVTSSPLHMDIDNEWTTKCFYKVALIFWIGNVGVNTIRIDHDWFFIEINQTMSDWDILLIDWVNKEVLHNTTNLDYDWVFTELNTDSNPMVVTINWTLNVDVTILFNKNYL